MRAKLIENIEFKRGEHPHKALGVGKYNGPLYTHNDDTDIYIQICDIEDFFNTNMPPQQVSYWNDYVESVFADMGVYSWDYVDNITVRHAIDKGLALIQDANRLDESLDFKRNEKPEKALAVGKYRFPVYKHQTENRSYNDQLADIDDFIYGNLGDTQEGLDWDNYVTEINNYTYNKWGVTGWAYVIPRMKKEAIKMGLNLIRKLGRLDESIDFKRGQDPKHSLGVGYNPEDVTYDMVVMFVHILSEGFFIDDIIEYFDTTKEEAERTYKYFNTFKDHFEYKSIESGKAGNSRLKFYLYSNEDKFVYDAGYDNSWELLISDIEFPNASGARILPNEILIMESINFKRGEEPYDALGVGSTNIAKLVDDKMIEKLIDIELYGAKYESAKVHEIHDVLEHHIFTLRIGDEEELRYFIEDNPRKYIYTTGYNTHESWDLLVSLVEFPNATRLTTKTLYK